ncbi:MAG: hypothetical protein JZU47_00495 [Prolixibacteraceae bacterium]|nr:hypothetical protein [Prolixibacteraceae bacterium]
MRQNKDDSFTINGNIYNGIKDLASPNTILKEMINTKFDVYQDKFGNFILRRLELYPCFDSHDYLHENRYYRQYMICKEIDEVNEKYNFIISHKERFNSCEYNSPLLAPLIYADDDQPIIKLMIKDEPNL